MARPAPDAYRALGLAPGAGDAEVRRAAQAAGPALRREAECLASAPRRALYAQALRLPAQLADQSFRLPLLSLAATVAWGDAETRARLWAAWARGLPCPPIGFQDVRRARRLDPGVHKGMARFFSAGYRVEVETRAGARASRPCLLCVPVQYAEAREVFAGAPEAALRALRTPELRCTLRRPYPAVALRAELTLPSEAVTQLLGPEALRDFALLCAEAMDEAAAEALGLPPPAGEHERARVEAQVASAALREAEAHELWPQAPYCLLEAPCILQGYRWVDTQRYICVNRATGDICGEAGRSRVKENNGRLGRWFRGVFGRGKGGKGGGEAGEAEGVEGGEGGEGAEGAEEFEGSEGSGSAGGAEGAEGPEGAQSADGPAGEPEPGPGSGGARAEARAEAPAVSAASAASAERAGRAEPAEQAKPAEPAEQAKPAEPAEPPAPEGARGAADEPAAPPADPAPAPAGPGDAGDAAATAGPEPAGDPPADAPEAPGAPGADQPAPAPAPEAPAAPEPAGASDSSESSDPSSSSSI